MKAFVINFNRLTTLVPLCAYLESTGNEVIIVDMNSTYPALLDYYRTTKYEVCRMKKNYRSYGFFYEKVPEQYGVTGEFILTDSDLNVSGLPADYIDVLRQGLQLFPNVWKCGLSIELNDLPDTELASRFFEWEKRHWDARKDGYYLADVATTFALYRNPVIPVNLHSGIRAPRPYTCRHVPTDMTRDEILGSQEEMNYIRTAITNGWSQVANEVFDLGITMTAPQQITFRTDDVGHEYGGESDDSLLKKFIAVDQIFKQHGLIHTVAIIAADIEKAIRLVEYLKVQDHISYQLHCWEHIDYSANHDKVFEHLRLGKQKIYDIFGAYPKMFFPPWNATDDFVNTCAREYHLTVSTLHSTLEGYMLNGIITNDTILMHYQHDSPVLIEQVVNKIYGS